uniref:Ripply transcriptional repressor 2 n=1 Tax=Falco tinnunculus TaxID=100819 RepID=A0A8C4TNN9_FALTI
MEGGRTGRGGPRPPSAALPPRGCSPLSRSPRCGARPGPALTALPSARRPAPFWRPWVPAPGEAARPSGPAAVSGAARRSACRRQCRRSAQAAPAGRRLLGRAPRAGCRARAAGLTSALSPQPHSPRGPAGAPRKLAQYTHPVRLFWPKSRCYDYLYQEAEALLKNFPVQATISFYEDSDSEDDEDDLEQDSRTESDC